MASFASWRGLFLDMLQNFQISQINKSVPENFTVFQLDDKCHHHDQNQMYTDYRVRELPNDNVSHLTIQCKAKCLHMCIADHVEFCRQRKAEVFCE
jgi:hypothetical protein